MAEIDPDALITASQAAQLCQVTVAAVCNWVTRGYLKPAKDKAGRTKKDSQGRIQYRLLDVAKAEAARRKECKGTTSLGMLSPGCAKADDKLSWAIADFVERGGQTPMPKR